MRISRGIAILIFSFACVGGDLRPVLARNPDTSDGIRAINFQTKKEEADLPFVLPLREKLALFPFWGLHYGSPERLAFTSGALWAPYGPPKGGQSAHCVAFYLRPGTSGGRVSAGYMLTGSEGQSVQLNMAAIRTWRDPLSVGPGQTYIGLELRGILILSASLGYFTRIAGHRPGDGSLIALNFGFGF